MNASMKFSDVIIRSLNTVGGQLEAHVDFCGFSEQNIYILAVKYSEILPLPANNDEKSYRI